MKKVNLLSKAEMKKVSGGNEETIGNLGCQHPYILFCTTPGGEQEWCRSSMEGNATDVCNGIYPAYGGSNVSGLWGPNIIKH